MKFNLLLLVYDVAENDVYDIPDDRQNLIPKWQVVAMYITLPYEYILVDILLYRANG